MKLQEISCYIITFSLLVMIGSCKVSKAQHNSVSGVDILKVASYEPMLTDTIVFHPCKFIALETNDISLIKNISRVYRDGEKLFVFDPFLSKLLVFNEQGKYLSHVRAIGRGPGEYLQAIDFCLDVQKKQIIILCDRPSKLVYYDYDGKFIRETSLVRYYNYFVQDDSLLYCHQLLKTDDKIDVLSVADGHIVNSLSFPALEYKQPQGEHIRTFSMGNFFTRGEGVHLTRQFDNCIYTVVGTQLIPTHYIDMGKHTLPKSLDSYGVDFLQECDRNKYVCSISDVVEWEDKLLFSTNIGLFVGDKKSETMKGYQILFNSQLWFGGGNILPVGNTKNQIIVYNDPFMVKTILRDGMNRGVNIVETDMMKALMKMEDDANKVLCLYELR